MITRIEIDGFKSFHDFSLDLHPLQVFIGQNGTGKSNLFDAIRLLSNTATSLSLIDAFNKNRGEASGLFSILPDDAHADEIFFAVELLIAKTIDDDLGSVQQVASTRLRYELKIGRRWEKDLVRLYVVHESLVAIPETEDEWVKAYIPTDKHSIWLLPSTNQQFIVTETVNDELFISKYYEKSSERRQSSKTTTIGRTYLSATDSAETAPTIYAVRRELMSWWALYLEPDKLRNVGSIMSPVNLLPDASNLGTVLLRMYNQNNLLIQDVLRDLTNIVPTIKDISIAAQIAPEAIFIELTTYDGSHFPWPLLSDGTLRVLALVTLKNDPEYKGVLCLEEPENGVHPLRLERIARMLSSMATDFNEETDEHEGRLRQLLVNTHSAALLPFIAQESISVVYLKKLQSGYATAAVPIKQTDQDQRSLFAEDQIRRFLAPQPLEKMLQDLGYEL